jgi:hypothetical protein
MQGYLASDWALTRTDADKLPNAMAARFWYERSTLGGLPVWQIGSDAGPRRTLDRELGEVTMRGNGLCAVAVLIALAACSGKHRPFADGLPGSGGMSGAANSEEGKPAANQASSGPGTLGEEASGAIQPG